MRRSPLSLKAQALALLARREHSRQELRSKLLLHARKLAQAEIQAGAMASGARCWAESAVDEGASSGGAGAADDEQAAQWQACVDQLLDELQAANYLSDERFAEVRVHARAAGQGQARIRQELARHGVELPEALADELRGSELERARALWQRRFGEVATDPRERARQMRFLAARGFSGEVVRCVTRGREAGLGGESQEGEQVAAAWHDRASE